MFPPTWLSLRTFTHTHNAKDARRFLQNVRQRDGRDLRIFPLRQLVQLGCHAAALLDLKIRLSAFAVGGVGPFCAHELAASERAP